MPTNTTSAMTSTESHLKSLGCPSSPDSKVAEGPRPIYLRRHVLVWAVGLATDDRAHVLLRAGIAPAGLVYIVEALSPSRRVSCPNLPASSLSDYGVIQSRFGNDVGSILEIHHIVGGHVSPGGETGNGPRNSRGESPGATRTSRRFNCGLHHPQPAGGHAGTLTGYCRGLCQFRHADHFLRHHSLKTHSPTAASDLAGASSTGAAGWHSPPGSALNGRGGRESRPPSASRSHG